MIYIDDISTVYEELMFVDVWRLLMFVVKLAVPVKGKISSAMSKFACLQEINRVIHYLLVQLCITCCYEYMLISKAVIRSLNFTNYKDVRQIDSFFAWKKNKIRLNIAIQLESLR